MVLCAGAGVVTQRRPEKKKKKKHKKKKNGTPPPPRTPDPPKPTQTESFSFRLEVFGVYGFRVSGWGLGLGVFRL